MRVPSFLETPFLIAAFKFQTLSLLGRTGTVDTTNVVFALGGAGQAVWGIRPIGDGGRVQE